MPPPYSKPGWRGAFVGRRKAEATFNPAYIIDSPDRLPTRSAFGAAGLALGARVEMECWAEV